MIWESLTEYFESKLPDGWSIDAEPETKHFPHIRVLRITHNGRNLHAPLTLMLLDDGISVYAEKDNSKDLFRTYGYLGHFCLADPDSLGQITNLIDTRLWDYR